MTVLDEATGISLSVDTYVWPRRNRSPTQDLLEFENDEITNINTQQYSNNQNLHFFVLPKNVTIINENAFRECK